MSADPERLFRDGAEAARHGRFESAVRLLRAALALKENDEVRRELVSALFEAKDFDAAEAVVAEGRHLYPAEIDYIHKHVRILVARGRIGLASAYLQDALARYGPARRLRIQAAGIRTMFGESAESLAILKEYMASDPTPDLACGLLYTYVYDESLDLSGLREIQRSYASVFPAAPARNFPAWDETRPLRIGYLAGAFYNHAAALVAMPVILRHDRSRVHVTCYTNHAYRDAVTMKLRFGVDRWRSVVGMDANAAAEMIYDDGIDVLVDFLGHTGFNRLDVFALRPAPVQVSAWGYLPGPGTPGIDYLVSDTVLISPSERASIPDTIIDVACPTFMEMPPLVCEAPPDNGAEIHVGVFCRSEKISRTSAVRWSKILAMRPHVRLILKGAYFDDAAISDHMRARFAPQVQAQLTFEGSEGALQYRSRLGRLDLAFDPFPYSGGVITLDALSQGTPVLTLPGKLPSARTTASILHHWNLEELIAGDESDFAERALALIDDRALRLRLREKILAQRSRFDDAYFEGIARSFEDAVMAHRRAT